MECASNTPNARHISSQAPSKCDRGNNFPAANAMQKAATKVWEFDVCAEAEGARFSTQWQLRGLWRRDRMGNCASIQVLLFSCALTKRAAWNPKLGCEGIKNIDGNALSVRGPMLFNVAMPFEERVGKDYFNRALHSSGTSTWGIDLGHMGMHMKEVKVKVAKELGYMYRMPRDAGNWVYATMFDEQVWDSITGDPTVGTEKKGDLIEFVLAFGSIAHVYPCAFQTWART